MLGPLVYIIALLIEFGGCLALEMTSPWFDCAYIEVNV